MMLMRRKLIPTTIRRSQHDYLRKSVTMMRFQSNDKSPVVATTGQSTINNNTTSTQQQQQSPLNEGTFSPVKIKLENDLKESKLIQENIRKNSVFNSSDEKNLVKRGAILSIMLGIALLAGTYYRSYIISRNRSLTWLPSLFVYAADDHFLHIESYFGRSQLGTDHKQNLDNVTKEERIRIMKSMDEASKGVVEL